MEIVFARQANTTKTSPISLFYYSAFLCSNCVGMIGKGLAQDLCISLDHVNLVKLVPFGFIYQSEYDRFNWLAIKSPKYANSKIYLLNWCQLKKKVPNSHIYTTFSWFLTIVLKRASETYFAYDCVSLQFSWLVYWLSRSIQLRSTQIWSKRD